MGDCVEDEVLQAGRVSYLSLTTGQTYINNCYCAAADITEVHPHAYPCTFFPSLYFQNKEGSG